MHIILYVLDALRADHLGCYGSQRDISPHIDEIALEGAVFENCFTSSTWTRPSAASILTGTYPAVHMTCTREDMFSTPIARLPEVLKNGGFKTAAFSTMGNLASEIGFERGFDIYHDLFRDPAILAKRQKRKTVRKELLDLLDSRSLDIALPYAEDVHSFLFPWLEQNHAENTFSFIWSIETHEPYIAPSEFRRFSPLLPSRANEGWPEDTRTAGAVDRKRLVNLYDDEIYYNDYCLGQIVTHLKALDIYNDTLLIITSDHGEAFYEHNIYGHGYLPYDELIHVPMIMKFPNGHYAGQRITGLAELVDIFPTVTSTAGLTSDSGVSTWFQGHDLLPLMDDPSSQVRENTFSDTLSPFIDTDERYLSVRNLEWKYILLERSEKASRTFNNTIKRFLKGDAAFSFRSIRRYLRRNYFARPGEYLFDLKTDPDEKKNMAAERPVMISQFRKIVETQNGKNDTLAEQVGRLPKILEESETLRRHLEALGYL
jgi:arylsulfatase A-like enzyme